jgi:hypothetical protein
MPKPIRFWVGIEYPSGLEEAMREALLKKKKPHVLTDGTDGQPSLSINKEQQNK